MSESAPRPRHLWRNPLTITGGTISFFAILFLLSFLFFDLIARNPSPYLGLFTYLVFPCILVLGSLLILSGLIVARMRHRASDPHALVHYYPRIDLGNPRQRRVATIGGLATATTLPIVGLLSYRGYHYTDSNEFCGRVCHEVMEPQFATYQHSPHAHVECAECHVGEGASGYIKSKLSGLRQVWSVATNTFPRPIPPAVQELRPANETCEQCHWPGRYYGNQLITIDHFASDEHNTHRPTQMLIKTGGSGAASSPAEGAHWHMSETVSIDYVALDHDLQEIPWVRMVDSASGKTIVYRSDGQPINDPPPVGIHRKMDCMDCHNRPAHDFHPATLAADEVLSSSPSLRTLPFAKRELTTALADKYNSKAEAINSIAKHVKAFYEKEHPSIWQDRGSDISRLISSGVDSFAANMFPAMHASWRSYPDNSGHMQFPGCFRCHEGQHKNAEGVAIRSECRACHEFIVPSVGAESRFEVSDFKHPIALDAVHSTVRCDKCHTGGSMPENSCETCHEDVVAFRAGTHEMFRPFKIGPDAMVEKVTCDGCHDTTQPQTIAGIDEKCMECHDDEPEKYAGMLMSWKVEERRLFEEAKSRGDVEANVLKALQRAGALHNMEATRKILSHPVPRAPVHESQ